MSITDVQLSVLENLLNRVIKTDPDMLDRLHKVAGKRIALHSYLISGFEFCIEFWPDGIRLTRDIDGVDASINAGPSSLLHAGLIPEDRKPFSDGRIEITGDTRLIQYLSSIIQEFEPDWQEPLSARVGDTLTWQFEQIVHKAGSFGSRLTEKIRLDSGEYLREESRVLAGEVAVGRFTDGVDEVLADFERLNQRIKSIEKRVNRIEVDK